MAKGELPLFYNNKSNCKKSNCYNKKFPLRLAVESVSGMAFDEGELSLCCLFEEPEECTPGSAHPPQANTASLSPTSAVARMGWPLGSTAL